jgi:general secretion pathway protein F
VVLALAAVWRTGRLRSIAVSIALRIEPLQRQLDEYRLAKLYQSLSLLFRGGYPLDESLALCADLQLGRLTPAVAAARRTLTCGVGVARAFEAAGLCDDVSERLLSVGERSGNFDQILATIGDRHAGRFSTFVERATRIVEPTLLLLVALTVGALVITMYMPIFDIASSVD